jgi:general secretion pathway protein A
VSLRAPGGEAVYAVLLALDDKSATLQAGSQRFELSLPALAQVWRGDYATFWRTPPAWRGEGAGAGAAGLQTWLDERLQAAGHAQGRQGQPGTQAQQGDQAMTLNQRVRAFQLAQGLPPDGRAGPITLMRLARPADGIEPQLVAPQALH